jgi:MFS family permease
VLGGARPLALYTPHVSVVYACYVPMVIALGVMNTAITTTASRLASKDQLGGFFGLLESVENVAGMMGPVAGGLLASVDGFPATLIAVVGLYALAAGLVALFFPTYCRADPAAGKGEQAQSNGAAAAASGTSGTAARTAPLGSRADAEKKVA